MTIEATLLNTFGGDRSSPYALTVGIDRSTGDVLVGDEYPYKIRRYSAAGSLIAEYDKPAEADGFAISGLLGDDEGKIWVCEFLGGYGQPRIYRLSATGTYEAGWFTGTNEEDFVNEPNELAISADGTFYATSTNWYNGTPDKTYGLRLSSAMAFEEQYGSGYEGDPGTGNYDELPPNGQVLIPVGIGADSAGDVYVTDVWGKYKTITKYASDGTFLSRFGGAGTGDGQFSPDTGIAEIWYVRGMKLVIDSQDRIFVSDKIGGRINVFDTAGTPLGSFGTGTLVNPVGIAVGLDDTIYVMDEWTQEVTQWQVGGGVPEFLIRGVSVVVCGDTDC